MKMKMPVSDRAGEAVVVLLLVARVISALHSTSISAVVSLTYETWGLLVLSAAALAVDSGAVGSTLVDFAPRCGTFWFPQCLKIIFWSCHPQL